MSNLTCPENRNERIKKIKAVLLDVDGVMTEGRILYDHRGREVKQFNVHDGLGIYLGREAGLVIGIITGRESKAVGIRAAELNVDYLSMGKKNKLNPFNEFLDRFDLREEEVAFLGDDILDMPVMRKCGLAVSVANGRQEVKDISHYVTGAAGGNGAVREVIEHVLKSQDKWDSFIEGYFDRLSKTDK